MRLTVGLPPGGQIDIIARLTGQWLSERLGQPFIVENRPGAGSNIGAEAVVRAPADGHMLFLASATNAINATLYDNLSFNFVRDTTPVASINCIPIVLKVHASFSAWAVAELVDHAKSNPGKFNLGTPSKGTGPYMAAELFKMMTGRCGKACIGLRYPVECGLVGDAAPPLRALLALLRPNEDRGFSRRHKRACANGAKA